jgi:hypothetical protein
MQLCHFCGTIKEVEKLATKSSISMCEIGSLTSRYAEENREQGKAVRHFVWGSVFALVTVSLYIELAICMGAFGAPVSSFY